MDDALCLSDSYKRVLDHFPAGGILGVTATPDRGDRKNLGEFFDSKAYEYSRPGLSVKGISVEFRHR